MSVGDRPRALDARLRELAREPDLLIASDFDGTLAPIVPDPRIARAEPGAVEALAALAALPRTHAAVISGRSRDELIGLTGEPAGVHLVGSHGGEFGAGFEDKLPADIVERRDRVAAELVRLARAAPGFLVEVKPASAAFHYRNAAPDAAERALEALAAGPMSWPGVWPKHGKMVVELSVIPANKGKALDLLRRELHAQRTIFVGDDLTDEDAFRRLGEHDLAIKVGSGPSAAPHRVPTTADVAALYAQLLHLRSAWAPQAPGEPRPASPTRARP